jgi:hypothetical protein
MTDNWYWLINLIKLNLIIVLFIYFYSSCLRIVFFVTYISLYIIIIFGIKSRYEFLNIDRGHWLRPILVPYKRRSIKTHIDWYKKLFFKWQNMSHKSTWVLRSCHVECFFYWFRSCHVECCFYWFRSWYIHVCVKWCYFLFKEN